MLVLASSEPPEADKAVGDCTGISFLIRRWRLRSHENSGFARCEVTWRVSLFDLEIFIYLGLLLQLQLKGLSANFRWTAATLRDTTNCKSVDTGLTLAGNPH